jgi:putative membrane protein
MTSVWLSVGLVSLHVFANLVWIGSIAGAGFLLARSGEKEEDKAFASAAAWLYQRVATPAFGVSFLAGVGRLALEPSTYMHAHWFHGKLTFALVVIALHHVIGARAKKARAGSMQRAKSGAILSVALLCATLLSVLFVLFKSALVP